MKQKMKKFINLKSLTNSSTRDHSRTRLAGISLIEVLVSIVIAGIIFSTVMVSYFSLIQTQQKTDIMRQMQKEVHFAIIRIADKIRANSIDYDAYSGGRCSGIDLRSSNKLCLGADNIFEVNGTRLMMNNSPLISEKFAIKKMYFYGSPTTNPVGNQGDKDSQFQPKVTIFLEVESLKDPSISMEVQTTISSRNYN